MSLSEYVQS
uniref:Uncharacterized protein n=1 Tax=Anguilla anguilla TaxID=7936 RepID=A0A0E9S200_ANGAN